jgi:hypothetical protein
MPVGVNDSLNKLTIIRTYVIEIYLVCSFMVSWKQKYVLFGFHHIKEITQ